MQEVSYQDGTYKFLADELTSMGYKIVTESDLPDYEEED